MRRPHLSRAAPALFALGIAACGAVPGRPAPTEPVTAPPPVALAEPTPAAAPPAPPPLPVRGEGPALPDAERVLSRIAFGWCSVEHEPLPVFAGIAATRPEIFLFAGGAVCGADLARAPDSEGAELRRAYIDLNLNAHFAAFNMSTPMLATWGEHELGPAGEDPGGRELAERMFETYWGLAALGGDRPGVYGSRVFGPVGRRVQLLLLDTQPFLAPGSSGQPAVLGEDQWRWLAAELRTPAEVRLIVSPLPMLGADGSGESWTNMQGAQRRLFDTVRTSGAEGVVLMSGGGRAHVSRKDGVLPYALHELTASPLSGAASGAGTPAGFGLVEVDWAGRTLVLSARGLDGAAEPSLRIPFRAIGL